MLNKRSDSLTVLVATYNRLDLLKRTLASVAGGTDIAHEIIVIDGGSTDGTVEYLRSLRNVTAVLQGALLGTARAYNQVWRQIDSKYTCWLSDDTEVVRGSLGLAVRILEEHDEIGMVGLKMRDTKGPWSKLSYKASISKFGIVTCNHAVMATSLLRAVGFFNESYHSYTIDSDLTASVLSAGKQVVMTKEVAILHCREWGEQLSSTAANQTMKDRMRGVNNDKIYREKFGFLPPIHNKRFRRGLRLYLLRALCLGAKLSGSNTVMSPEDLLTVSRARYIRLKDAIETMQCPYHLVQRIPRDLLVRKTNPYRHLVENGRSEATVRGLTKSVSG